MPSSFTPFVTERDNTGRLLKQRDLNIPSKFLKSKETSLKIPSEFLKTEDNTIRSLKSTYSTSTTKS